MILDRNFKPFWNVTPPEGVTANPLNYRCAPNAAGPDYVASRNVEDFIAYCFWRTFVELEPDSFELWWRLERNDIQALREMFLRTLETVAELVWADETEAIDCLEIAEYLFVGEEGEDDDSIGLYWDCEGLQSDGALRFAFKTLDGFADPSCVWLDMEALGDREAVKAAIANARKINSLDKAAV